MKRTFFKLIFLLLPWPLCAQTPPAKNYFRDPLDIPISLAGNFGELRPNHFHMGLDIRTERREHLPVFAAAQGYISRVKIEPWGFGQAIYIDHPNGYRTVYAHLSAFFPQLAAYVKQEQYLENSWSVEIEIPPGLFPVQKGSLIAYSGNTGGSLAPHLHFEIREIAEDINMNPLLFGLPVKDQNRPTIARLAIYDRTQPIYEQTPLLFPVHKKAGAFTILPKLITVHSPRISVGVSAFDTQSGSSNPLGIYEATLYDQQHPVAGFRIRQISYAETKNINAHIDYRTKARGGPYIQQLFRLQGYLHSIYLPYPGEGILDLADGRPRAFRIEVKDAYGNSSNLPFRIQYRPSLQDKGIAEGKFFYPQLPGGVEQAACSFFLGEHCLYDSARVAYRESLSATPLAVSSVQSIGSPAVPLQDSFTVRIKPTRLLSAAEMDRVVMQRNESSLVEVRKVEWRDGWACASFNDFGDFQLLLDTEPPVIRALDMTEGADLSRAIRIAFTVNDNLNAYKHFNGWLDGKWLLFSHDKARAFIYTFDEHCPGGPHELRLSVEDEAGNQTGMIMHFSK